MSPAWTHAATGIVVALILAVVLLYARTTGYPFLEYDDQDYVWRNEVVRRGLTADGLRWAFSTYHAGNWHPLTWLSHMADCQAFGVDRPGAHHLVNVALHALNSVLVFVALRRLTGQQAPSAIVAALFAVHPLAVESVAWIAERKNLLAMLFCLLAILAYERFARSGRWRWYGAVMLAFALSLMAKPSWVTLPFALLLLDHWPLQRMDRGNFQARCLEKAPLLVLTLISCWLTMQAQQIAQADVQALPWEARLSNAVVSYAAYLRQTFWPTDLAVLYPHPLGGVSAAAVVGSVVLLIAVTLITWFVRRPYPFGLIGWLWFLGTLVPTLGLVQVGMQARADRYSYGPLLGIYAIVAFGAAELASRTHRPRLTLLAPSALAILALAAVTTVQVGYWSGMYPLFQRCLDVGQKSAVAHMNVALALRQQGKVADAVAQFRAAAAREPRRIEIQIALGQTLLDAGELEPAEQSANRALGLDANHARAWFLLGQVRQAQNRSAEAEAAFRRAIELGLRNVPAYFNLGLACLRQGKRAEGIAALEAALKLAPDDAEIQAILARERR